MYYQMGETGMHSIEKTPVYLSNPKLVDGVLRCSQEIGEPIVKLNPFRNLLEMITFYYGVAERNDPDELDAFLDNEFSKSKDKYPKLVNAEDIDDFIIQSIADSLFKNNSQSNNEAWMDFDVEKMEEILRNKFFEEYNSKIVHRSGSFQDRKFLYEEDGVKVYEWEGDYTPDLRGVRSFPRDYGLLELYTYTKLQAQAACALSDDRTNMMWYLWCYHDVIEQLYEFRFYDCVGTVYQKYGKEWFAHSKVRGTDFEPILFKWAAYAIHAAHHSETVEARKLKHDLVDLMSEFILSTAMVEKMPFKEEVVMWLKNAIVHFDDDHEALLQNQIAGFVHQNYQLKKDYETLQKNYETLRGQIEDMQEDHTRTDDEKIDAILKRIYTFMPEDISFDQDAYRLADIWERFSPATQKDIRTSLALYEKMKTPDLAALVFVSSLEREMKRNFFEPFKESAAFKKIKNKFCPNKNLLDVHRALAEIDRHPTLGNIPFIKKAILSQQSKRDSAVVAAFAQFLGKDREDFCSICDAIEKYRLGTKKYTVVKLRNGLAHGDEAVKEGCDERCYHDLMKMFYEPPIQIMFSIIAHSKK